MSVPNELSDQGIKARKGWRSVDISGGRETERVKLVNLEQQQSLANETPKGLRA